MKETVRIEIEMPITDYTQDELIEWLRFNLNYTAQISEQNPLYEHELYADKIELLYFTI